MGGGRSSGASGIGLRGTGRPPEGPGGTLVAPGARRDAWFGRRRAETATATWTATRGFGRGGERRYGAETRGRREGNGGGAHRGPPGLLVVAGDAFETANRSRRPAASEEESDLLPHAPRPIVMMPAMPITQAFFNVVVIVCSPLHRLLRTSRNIRPCHNECWFTRSIGRDGDRQ